MVRISSDNGVVKNIPQVVALQKEGPIHSSESSKCSGITR